MFGDPNTNSLGLSSVPMTEVCGVIDGDRGSNYPKQEDFSKCGDCLFLSAKNVTADGFIFDECLFISGEKDKQLRSGKLMRGDIVLTTRGTIGNMAFYDDSVPFENVRINSGMVILRMNRSNVNELFFIEQFRMKVKEIKKRIASGSAQPQLPITTMRKIRIILPSLHMQNEFARFVEQTDKSKIPCEMEVAA